MWTLAIAILADVCFASLPTFIQNCSVPFSPSSDYSRSLFQRSLTYKELRELNQRQCHPQRLTTVDTLDYGKLLLRQRGARYLKLQNPWNNTVEVQLFLMLEKVEDVLRKDCIVLSSHSALDDEELETDSPTCAVDEKEVPAAKAWSEASSPPIRRFTGDWALTSKLQAWWSRDFTSTGEEANLSWLPRQKSEGGWIHSNLEHNIELLVSQTQSFYLSDQAKRTISLPPRTSTKLLIYFHPTALGSHSAHLFIRNNHTGQLEALKLRGETLLPRLAFDSMTIYQGTHQILNTRHPGQTEMTSLSFEVSKIHIIMQQVLQNGVRVLPETLHFTRQYRAKNLGNAPMVIKKVLLGGVSCSLMGFTVVNCDEGALVAPGEVFAVNITYESELLQTQAVEQLWIVTEHDAAYIPLELSIDVMDVSPSKFQGTTKNSLTYRASEFSILLVMTLAAGYAYLVTKDFLTDVRSYPKRCERERSVSFLQRVPLCKSPQLQPMDPPKAEPVEFEPLPLLSSPMKVSPTDPPKVRKVRRHKHPVLKFSPATNFEPIRQQAPEIFASYRWPGKPAKITDSPEGESDEEQPQESQGSTSFSEEDDVFLDDYKTRQGLFSGFRGVD